MIEKAPGKASNLARLSRFARLSLRSLLDAKRPADKISVLRHLLGYSRLRMGLPVSSQEVSHRFREFSAISDISRGELVSYWEIWHENAYQALPQFCASENSRIVDVGGNIGFYAIKQALRATHGKVISFEPSRTAFSRLKRNIEINNLTNVIPIQAAISDCNGNLVLEETSLSVNCRVVSKPTGSSTMVPSETLDEAMCRLHVDSIDILKIDTEGHERSVLRGAVLTLPFVERAVIEIHNDFREEKTWIDGYLRTFGLTASARFRDVVYYER